MASLDQVNMNPGGILIQGNLKKSLLILSFNFIVLTFSAHVVAANKNCAETLGMALDPMWVMSKLDEIKTSETREQRRVRDATANGGFEFVALNNDALKYDTLYTKTVYPTDTVDQEQAGTCWIFAQLNVYRTKMTLAGLVPAEFKFSTNYTHFFDMLEKSNTRFTMAILAAEKYVTPEALYKQIRREIDLVGDGGYPNYLPQLVEKYGLVPYESMPDTVATKSSDVMIEEINRQINIILNEMVRKSVELKKDKSLNRTARVRELLKIKEIGMSSVAKILVTHLGHPPTEINVALNYSAKKDGKNVRTTLSEIKNMSPITFAKEVVQYNSDDFVIIARVEDLPPGYYVVKRSSIAIPGVGESSSDMKFINLGKDAPTRMQELTMKSIDKGIAVEFSADVGKDLYVWYGALDPNIYDRDGMYSLTPEEQGSVLTKKEERLLGQTYSTHEMVFTGYDQRDGQGTKPRRFLVKNSWGIYYGAKMEGVKNKSVQDGDFHMKREWFEKYVTDIVVPSEVLSKAEIKLLSSKPKRITYKKYQEL